MLRTQLCVGVKFTQGRKDDLGSDSFKDAETQAMTAYSQRFVTHRLDASCLHMALSGHFWHCKDTKDWMLHSILWMCLQLQQLPENVREGLSSSSATEEARAQAMTEYSQRFVTHRLDASCLNVASSGQSSTVNAALAGGDQFKVGLALDVLPRGSRAQIAHCKVLK